MDLLVGGINHQGLYWYENPSWTKHTIDSKASIQNNGRRDENQALSLRNHRQWQASGC
jgi:hypothetical protein